MFHPDHDGYVCIATAKPDMSEWKERFFKWPGQAERMLDHVEKMRVGHNVWFCPHLLDGTRRVKGNATVPTAVLWADLDTCRPDIPEPPPSVVVTSSPGRWQAYWRLTEPAEPNDVESVNQRIAYLYQTQGADISGWDLSQLLRVPYTHNYKYDGNPQVSIEKVDQTKYTLDDFENLPRPAISNGKVTEMIESMPNLRTLPDAASIMSNYVRSMSAPDAVFQLFYNQPHPKNDDWSKLQWRLIQECAEAGMEASETFAVVSAAACNKYKRENRSPKGLWMEVVKAYTTRSMIIGGLDDSLAFPTLLTDEERKLPRTLVEDYVEFACERTDAAISYHRAGALMIVSCLISGSVKTPISYNMRGVVPNLWVMLLAPSTVSRKTTAMSLVRRMIEEVDPDVVMATDATPEGLLTAMSVRSGQVSLFYKDEITGMLSSVGRKEYMRGFVEALITLYDNQNLSRQLSKSMVKVNDPIFPMFSGGIKDKAFSMMETESVASGFIPRTLMVSCKVDELSRKFLTIPTEMDMTKRNDLIREYRKIYAKFRGTIKMKVGGVSREMKADYLAVLTPDALARLNELDQLMYDTVLRNVHNSLAQPMLMRITEKALKLSTIFACMRNDPDEHFRITVDLEDMLQALKVLDDWMPYMQEAIEEISSSGQEHDLTRVLRYIQKHPGGVRRSQVLKNFGMSARTFDEVLRTLDQRAQIQLSDKFTGKGQMIYPMLPNQKEHHE